MALSKERLGEIALAMVKDQFRSGGFRFSKNSRRELGETANRINVPVADLEQFALDILPEMIGEAFGYEHVSVIVSDRKRLRVKD